MFAVLVQYFIGTNEMLKILMQLSKRVTVCCIPPQQQIRGSSGLVKSRVPFDLPYQVLQRFYSGLIGELNRKLTAVPRRRSPAYFASFRASFSSQSRRLSVRW